MCNEGNIGTEVRVVLKNMKHLRSVGTVGSLVLPCVAQCQGVEVPCEF